MTFKITVENRWFGKMTGCFSAPTKAMATEDAKRFYSDQLDVKKDDITILMVKKA